MAFIGTVTGSFKAGRRASTYSSAAWSATDITPIPVWFDASDTPKLYS